MAREEDEQQRLFREARMHKGKEASTASARREKRWIKTCMSQSLGSAGTQG